MCMHSTLSNCESSDLVLNYVTHVQCTYTMYGIGIKNLFDLFISKLAKYLSVYGAKLASIPGSPIFFSVYAALKSLD